MSSRFGTLLRDALGGICEVTEFQVAVLEGHYDLMIRWNRKVSLTTVTQVEEAVVRHYAESLFLAAHLPPSPLSVVDVGSGAGFPGFPCAVFRSDCRVTLVESVKKKAVFLQEASREVKNLRVLPARAEMVTGEFDWIVSRAVAWRDIPVLAPRFALLSGPPESDCYVTKLIQLPWGRQRYLVIGEHPAKGGA